MTAPTPVLRFLPDADLSTGPFGVLGLPAAQVAIEQVEQSLQRQLTRLARHPLGRTTEADEVRLALHVAAAQLRDPRVQEELLLDLATIRRPRPAAPSVLASESPRAVAASPATATPAAAAPGAFEQAALAVIVYSGGWNREAQRRLASLAHVFNLDPQAVRLAIVRMAGRTGARRAPEPSASEPVETTRIEDPSRSRWRWVAPIVLGLTLVGSAVMVGVLWRLTRRPPAAAPALAATAPKPVEGTEQLTPASDDSAEPSGSARAERPAVPQPVESAPPSAPAPSALAETVARWATVARRALERSESADPTESLRAAERLARINLAALRLLSGDAEPLEAIEDSAVRFESAPRPPGSVASAAEPDLRAMTAHARAPDGNLAELFLLARRSPGQNVDAIKRMMAPAHALGPSDCDALANAAFVGSPPEIRSVARRFIEPQLSNPFMIHAMLEALPLAPARDEVSALIEQASLRRLPRPGRPEWRLEARRALLARLAEVLASGDATTDPIAEALLTAWRSTSGSSTPSAGPAFLGGGAFAELDAGSQAASALFDAWRDRASRAAISRESRDEVSVVVRGRMVERLVAHGVIERAVVDQKAAAALAGFVVARESPGAAEAVRRILNEAAETRARSTHVFQQIEATERAVTRLWFLRFGLDAPEVPR